MNDQLISIVTEAKRLIQNGWTKGSSARDRMGEPVVILNSMACSFCLVGALDRATGGLETIDHLIADKLTNEIVRVIRQHYPSRGGYLSIFNDDLNTTQADVLNVLDLVEAEFRKENNV